MKKKLFIIGIGGLTGSKLAILAIDDFEVYGSYNLRNPKFSFVESVKLDILDTNKLKETLSNIHPDIIINASGIINNFMFAVRILLKRLRKSTVHRSRYKV